MIYPRKLHLPMFHNIIPGINKIAYLNRSMLTQIAWTGDGIGSSNPKTSFMKVLERKTHKLEQFF